MNSASDDILNQEDGHKTPSWQNRLLKRILPLLLLGSAIALVVVQLTNVVTYKTILQLELGGNLRAELKNLEILVEDPSNRDEVLSTTVFNFDLSHRPAPKLDHILVLTRGEYSILFKMFGLDGSVRQSRRKLDVSSDSTATISLP
jgi:hypothetical protein